MEKQGGNDLQDTRAPVKIKTSAAALGSFICGIAGVIIIPIIITMITFSTIEPGMGRVNASARIIVGLCSRLCSVFSMIIGIVGLVRIYKSAGRLEGSGFAISGLVFGVIGSIVFWGSFMGSITPSKNSIAKKQIVEFEQMLEAYAKDNGSLPTTEQGLEELLNHKGKEPYLKKVLPDPWGRPYHYRNPGVQNPDSYNLWSNGHDGIEGTEDDLTN
jgi:general secretion pathway protein G